MNDDPTVHPAVLRNRLDPINTNAATNITSRLDGLAGPLLLSTHALIRDAYTAGLRDGFAQGVQAANNDTAP